MSNTRRARKAEATGVPDELTVTFNGTPYRFTRDRALSIEVLEAVEDDKLITAVRTLLGGEQWATYKQQHSSIESLNGFFTAVNEKLGLGLGNSSASPSSSESMARPSKPTSSGSTDST